MPPTPQPENSSRSTVLRFAIKRAFTRIWDWSSRLLGRQQDVSAFLMSFYRDFLTHLNLKPKTINLQEVSSDG